MRAAVRLRKSGCECISGFGAGFPAFHPSEFFRPREYGASRYVRRPAQDRCRVARSPHP